MNYLDKIYHFDSFEAIKNDWCAFEKNAEHYVFQTYNWLRHWYECVGQYEIDQLCLCLVVDKHDNPQLLLPLGIFNKKKVRVLSWLGGEVGDFQCPLLSRNFVTTAEDFQDFWGRLLEGLPKFDTIHFCMQPEKIGLVRNPFLLLKNNYVHMDSLFLQIEGTWDDYYKKKVNKKIRDDSRRQRKRLKELGEICFHQAQSLDKEDMQRLTSKMMMQKERRMKETESVCMFDRADYESFYLGLAGHAQFGKQVHVSSLSCGGEIIATHWGVVYNNRYYYLMPAFEGGKWMRFSAGRLLLEHLIEESFKRELDVFDFTCGGESYKLDWSDQKMHLYRYLAPVTIKGRAYTAMENARIEIQTEHPKIHQRLSKLKHTLAGVMHKIK